MASVRNTVKVGRVQASGHSAAPAADLFLDKDSGVFYGRVGERRVEGKTKAEAERKLFQELRRVTGLEWRGVIILRVPKRDDHSDSSRENDLIVYGAGCQFEYLRRERADNPRPMRLLKRTETFEREHVQDFNLRVTAESERAALGGFDKEDKKQRAAQCEARLRKEREDSSQVQTQWKPWRGEQEIVLPYSDEAWAGLLRIDAALRETQARLDAFAASATVKKLILLSTSPLLPLPAASTKGAV